MTIEDQEMRNCANCACHLVQENQSNKMEKQSFCRRDTPVAMQARFDRPVIRDGKPVMLRDGKTVLTQAVTEIVYSYKATLSNLVCFDGWRPLGTLPGDKLYSSDGIIDSMKRLYTDMVTQGAERMPESSDFGIDDLVR